LVAPKGTNREPQDSGDLWELVPSKGGLGISHLRPKSRELGTGTGLKSDPSGWGSAFHRNPGFVYTISGWPPRGNSFAGLERFSFQNGGHTFRGVSTL